MFDKKYYVFCEDDCKYESMTKEQTLAAIMQAVSTGEIQDIDTGFVTNVNVSVDTSTHTYSADKTFEEIYAALQAGRFVFVTCGGSCFFVDLTDAAKIVFVRHYVDTDSGEVLANKLSVTSNNVWSMTTDAVTASGDTGAVYIAVDSTDDVIFTVNGETYTDIQALINDGKLVVVRWEYYDFYYFETFGFSDSSGNHIRLNFRCDMDGIVFTLTLKDDNTWVFSQNILQTSSITDKGGYFTSDTVEGALQEIGAELAGINTLLGSGIQISFTIDGETFSVVSGTTFTEWIGTSRVISETSGLTLYVSADGYIFADEAGVYALSLDGSTAVNGSDKIISGATYTIINWVG